MCHCESICRGVHGRIADGVRAGRAVGVTVGFPRTATDRPGQEPFSRPQVGCRHHAPPGGWHHRGRAGAAAARGPAVPETVASAARGGSGPPAHSRGHPSGTAITECDLPGRPNSPESARNADYSHPAADAHPRVEARRLSIRRRADVGRCRTSVRSARAMCCLWVMNTATYVSGVSCSLPLLRWPGPISGPESWPTLGVWPHAIG
jgi:hypothetical protein